MVNRVLLYIFLGLAMALPGVVRAQEVTAGPDSVVVSTPADSGKAVKPKGLTRPAKAALWALIPGGGQVYNHDYWKLPIVYGALGGMAFLVVFNHSRYQEFRRGYAARIDGDPLTVDTGTRSSRFQRDETVLRARNYYRRNRDLSTIFTGVAYGMSIMEALVDAHLATFSVSEDLTLRVTPAAVPLAGTYGAPGVGLTLIVR